MIKVLREGHANGIMRELDVRLDESQYGFMTVQGRGIVYPRPYATERRIQRVLDILIHGVTISQRVVNERAWRSGWGDVRIALWFQTRWQNQTYLWWGTYFAGQDYANCFLYKDQRFLRPPLYPK